MKKECIVCGEEFETKHSFMVHCSRKCNHAKSNVKRKYKLLIDTNDEYRVYTAILVKMYISIKKNYTKNRLDLLETIVDSSPIFETADFEYLYDKFKDAPGELTVIDSIFECDTSEHLNVFFFSRDTVKYIHLFRYVLQVVKYNLCGYIDVHGYRKVILKKYREKHGLGWFRFRKTKEEKLINKLADNILVMIPKTSTLINHMYLGEGD